MTSPYKSLDVDDLRRDLSTGACAPRSLRGELFGTWIEVFPVRWDSAGKRPSSVPLEPRGAEPGLIELVLAFARPRELELVRPGDAPPAGQGRARARFTFEPGGRLRLASKVASTPAQAFADAAGALDALSSELASAGVALVSLGSDPWRSVDELDPVESDPLHACFEQVFAGASAVGRAALRQTCSIGVELDPGTPVQAPARWRAAQLLAPLATAIFSSSCLAGGVHTGFKGFRSRAWRLAEPSRTAPPSAFPDDPKGERAAQYLEFALAARVLCVRHAERWSPQTRPIGFAQWMEFGIGGLFPDLDDWHFHLSTLRPPVRPNGMVELGCFDSLPRAYWSVPLVWSALLLADSRSLERVLALLEPHAADLPARAELAERAGLLQPGLAADARQLFAIAADALLDSGERVASRAMQAAFIAFAERLALKGRNPSDDLLEVFLAHGALDRNALARHERELAAAAGLAL